MSEEKPTTIFFIRHGETPSNALKIKQGIKVDDYLDTKGILEMQDMGKLIAHLNLDVLFTSYLHRSEESAVILEQKQENPTPIMHDFRIRERDFGSLSGKSDSELEKIIPNRMELERLQQYDYHPYGGESVTDVRQRVFSALLDICTNYAGKRVGIITHGGVIRLMLFHFPEIPRIYHAQENPGKDISNADIYEWDVTEGKIANMRSLLLHGNI